MTETTYFQAVTALAIAGVIGAVIDQGKRGGGALMLAILKFFAAVYLFWILFDSTGGNIAAMLFYGCGISIWFGAETAAAVISYLGIECYINHWNKAGA